MFYEIGIRHTLGGPTIQIVQDIEDVPFDLRSYGVLTYGWKLTNERIKFKEDIKRIIEKIESKLINLNSPIHKYLNP